MRAVLTLLPVLCLALSACSSSSGGSTPPSKTYIIMPSGDSMPCGPGTNTTCPAAATPPAQGQ